MLMALIVSNREEDFIPPMIKKNPTSGKYEQLPLDPKPVPANGETLGL